MPQSLTRVVDILSYLLHSGSWVCLVYICFSRMRSEGFLFLSGGFGGGTVFVPISG